MNAARFIIGLTIFATGIFLLLENFGLVNVNWQFVVQFWPILLIIWGVSLLAQKPSMQYLLALLTMLLFGALFIFYGQRGYTLYSVMPTTVEPQSQSLTVSYTGELEGAKLDLSLGAGTFTIGETTPLLVSGESRSTLGNYAITETGGVQNPTVTIVQIPRRHAMMWNPARWADQSNELNLSLNEQVIWQIQADTGAAKVNFDLSPFKIARFELDTGAADSTLTFGNALPETEVFISAGASKIVLRVPEESGVEVQVDAGATSKDMADLTEIEAGSLWRSANFDQAANKILISIDAGASSLRLERY